MISKIRSIFLLSIFLVSTQTHSADEGILGIWKTESSDKGFLHVSMENCGDAICGTIKEAISLEGESNPDYKFLGKKMLWDMASSGGKSWSNGKIWDPTKDKTYKSKMTLSEDVLKVSGCIAFICKSQTWTKVSD